jgi:LPS sulfotransferase NodH
LKRLVGGPSKNRPRPLAERGYIICATARTGSSFFDELLSSTGVLGRPQEYFSYIARRHSEPDYPSDPRKQLRMIRTAGATPNGIYGVKLLASHFKLIDGRVDPFQDLPNARLIRLRRLDLLDQAISLARAEQTGKYGSRLPAKPPLGYDAAHIRACTQTLRDEEARLDAMIAEVGATPISLDYETLIADPQAAVDRVAALMEIAEPTPIRWQKVHSRIQRDEISAEWRRRFLAEVGPGLQELPRAAAAATPPSPPGSASAS